MNENLDLTKILDGCPVGTKFYSSVHGDVFFIGIDCHGDYPIIMNRGNIWNDVKIAFASKGTYFKDCGECILFPSKDQRDWSKFERFWDKPKVEKFDPKTLQHFDKIIVRDGIHDIWTCTLFSYFDDLNDDLKVITVGSLYRYCIPFNKETKHLIGTSNDCPEYYKWWEE